MLDKLGAFIERQAGHITVSLILIGIGALLFMGHIPKGEDLIPFALGVLARSMVGDKQ